MADKRYGASSSSYGEQSVKYPNGYITGLNSHLIALENNDPNLTNYPFPLDTNWIVLRFNRCKKDFLFNAIMVTDQVSGYTNNQLFNAFSSSTYTLHDYRIRLLQQTSNPTSQYVPNLFAQYGYY